MSSLSIDSVIFGFEGALKVLLIKHSDGISTGKWALPGGFVGFDESLDTAASRILFQLTGLNHIYLEQLKAFGAVDRFPEGRVVTISYYALIQSNKIGLVPGFTASEVKWAALNEIGALPYDHNEILNYALKSLQQKVKLEPVGFNLLPKSFSLLELQKVYESILQIKLDKPNFRRKILKTGLLKKSKGKQKGVPHRAAMLFEFDEAVYQKFKTQKFILEF